MVSYFGVKYHLDETLRLWHVADKWIGDPQENHFQRVKNCHSISANKC